MGDEKLKLPRASFDELCKVIRAYGQLGEPAGATEVSKAAALSLVTVSANNKFLLGIGVIEGGQKKQVTSKGENLARAIEHQMPGEQRRYWREIVGGSDFLSRLVTAVRIRKGMDEETLKSHIAYAAGEPNKGFVMTGAKAVIDLLRAAELIREDDGKLTAVEVVSMSIPETPKDKISPVQADAQKALQAIAAGHAAQGSISPFRIATTMPGIHLTINVEVQCGPDELADLGSKLRKVIEDFNEAEAVETDPGERGDD